MTSGGRPLSERPKNQVSNKQRSPCSSSAAAAAVQTSINSSNYRRKKSNKSSGCSNNSKNNNTTQKAGQVSSSSPLNRIEGSMSALAKAQQAKALEYVSTADKLLAKKSWFGGNEKNKEEAAEALLQAANAYKVGGLNQEAGATYNRVGDLYKGLNQYTEAAKAYNQAGSCFKKVNPVDAVAAYQSAISLMMDGGRLTQAAKMSRECAELFENDDTGDYINKAIEFYNQAADFFDMEDSKAQASSCRAKVAELSSVAKDPPDLLMAGRIYNDLGMNCLDSNLLKFNAKGYFLQSVLCQLANGDAIGAQNSIQRYEAVDYTFAESREGRFCQSLVTCVDQYDIEGFSQASFEYDRISKLDPWKTSMLVKIKRGISSGGVAGGDDDLDLT